jgi:hypothetical protein
LKPTDDEWVHATNNFVWHHTFSNVHETMMADILHSLLKGIIMHLLDWIKGLLGGDVHVKRRRRRKGVTLAVNENGFDARIDDRFKNLPPFPGLKHFSRYSSISQWTGEEQKAIVRTLLVTILPLMKQHTEALLYIRAVLDFVTAAQFSLHSDETLSFMEAALQRMDILNNAFRKVRLGKRKREGDVGHFNFPKYHALSHFVGCVRDFGSAKNVDSACGETGHRVHLKDFYPWTNKRAGWEDQLLLHNTRQTNILAMNNLLEYHSTIKTMVPQSRWNPRATIAKGELLNLQAKLGLSLSMTEVQELRKHDFNPSNCCRAWKLAQCLEIPNFVGVLAVFLSKVHTVDKLMDSNKVFHAAANSFVSMRTSIECWQRSGEASLNGDQAWVSHLVRACPDWQKTGKWRNDFVWVQSKEFDQTQSQTTWATNKRVGQVKAILDVYYPQDNVTGKSSYTRYNGVLVQTYQYKNLGIVDPVHGMIELDANNSTTSSPLESLQMYPLTSIIRIAHVVSDSEGSRSPDSLYVNNYIDWDQFNELYSYEYNEQNIEIARKYANKLVN